MSPLNRSAQAGMGSGAEGRGEQGASFGPGSRERGPAGPASGFDPSREALLTIAAIIRHWLDWDAERRGDSEVGPDNHIVIPPTWPSRQQFEHWIAALERAASSGGHSAIDETEAVPSRLEIDTACALVNEFTRLATQNAAASAGYSDHRYYEHQGRARAYRHAAWLAGLPLACVSDEHPQGENASAVEGEACQRGGEAETPNHSPDPLSQTVAPYTEEKE